MTGPLIILSGPSGSGKSTIASRLLAMPELRLRPSISATTRQPREGEQHGKHYYFIPADEFRRMADAGEFLEYAEVFGKCYGTPRRVVENLRRDGYAVLLVIDVQGAALVRRACPDAISIFLKPPSPQVLERRLRSRHTEDEASILARLVEARNEETHADEYTYRVVNDDLDTAVREIRTIILNHLTH